MGKPKEDKLPKVPKGFMDALPLSKRDLDLILLSLAETSQRKRHRKDEKMQAHLNDLGRRLIRVKLNMIDGGMRGLIDKITGLVEAEGKTKQ